MADKRQGEKPNIYPLGHPSRSADGQVQSTPTPQPARRRESLVVTTPSAPAAPSAPAETTATAASAPAEAASTAAAASPAPAPAASEAPAAPTIVDSGASGDDTSKSSNDTEETPAS